MLSLLRRLMKAVFQVGLPLSVLLLASRLLTTPEEPMPPSSSPKEVATVLLAEKGIDLLSISLLQSLWAGYGQICHITAADGVAPRYSAASPDHAREMVVDDQKANTENLRESLQSGSTESTSTTYSYILKLITPPPTRVGDEGHTRKILSYQVEQYFYSHLAPQLPASVPVAKCLASINQHHPDGTSTTAMILSDLKQDFPVAGEKRGALSSTQINAALDWLSGFHGFWWPRAKEFGRSKLVLPPLEEVRHDGQDASEKTVWLNGGYTYLATRRKEYASLANDDDSEWMEPLTGLPEGHSQSISEMVAEFLAPSTLGQSPIEGYQTLIHGDVKSENLFTSQSGKEVAFYDFQYTGLGLGVCDLAKLFTCSVPLSMLVADKDVPRVLKMQDGEKQLLQRYWKNLRAVSKKDYEWETLVQHWEIALVDWLRFQASWGFWGNTEWLEARVRSILMDEQWREALATMVGTK